MPVAYGRVIELSGGPPQTERQEVTENFFGQSVTDPYRWLENLHDLKVEQWLRAQDDYTRCILATIPGRAKFLTRVKALDMAGAKVRKAQVWGGKTFYLKTEAGADNAKLYVQDSAGSPERLLVNPELLTKGRVHYSIDYFRPSLDASRSTARFFLAGLDPPKARRKP